MTQHPTPNDFDGSMSAKPSVALIGEGPTALAALQSLLRCCTVVGILRTVDNPAEDPVHKLAAETGIPMTSWKGPEQLEQFLTSIRPAAVVISSFNLILPPPILRLSRFINVHFSLLPRYRGRANINWAMINGEHLAGISVHLVEPGLDSGNIIFQSSTPIGTNDSVASVYERLNAIQQDELGPAVVRAIGGYAGVAQDHREATYGCGRVPDDGEIDWSKSTSSIDRLVRALAPPFPGAFTHIEMEQLIIARAAPVLDPPIYSGRVPGRIVGRSRAGGWVDVLTGDGVFRIFEVIASGSKSSCPATTFIRSTRQTLGLSRLDLLRRVLALEQQVRTLSSTPPKAVGSEEIADTVGDHSSEN
jgi:methionyl-tRNA formyltransferase